MRAIRFEQTGGPEVLQLVEVDAPSPAAGQIVVRNQAIGLNFIDTYQRSGLYPIPLPSGLGSEGAGIVEAVGDGVTRFKAGDLVAYATAPLGAYADLTAMPAEKAVKLPGGVDVKTAAAAMLKGMTVEFLLNRCAPVRPGQTILVHAAAGGVGQIMVQWAKAIGATVIATVGSEAKAGIVQDLGADHVILYRDQDVAAEVKAITGGQGVAIAYDSVGKDTFEGTLASLSRRGVFVSFGNASGAAPPVDPRRLSVGGSLYFTRPTLFDYVATTEELDASAAALFGMITSGKVKIDIGQTYALTDVAQAHADLQGRKTSGASLLIP